MKKLSLLGICCLLCLFLTGCDADEPMKVYTTVYPIKYLVDTLYGTHAETESVYPNGTDIENVEFTKKQLDTFSKGSLFIYNGTSNEKNIAKSLVSKRKNLKIIDVAYSLKVKYDMEELWLSNYLMLATNLKDGLESQLGSRYLNEEIDNNFKILEERLSMMDADMRMTAKQASNRNEQTIVVSSNVFKFLEDYGFTVLSLEDYEEGSSTYESLKNSFRSGTYKYLLIKNNEENNKITDFTTNANATTIGVSMMHTLTEEDVQNQNNYFTIMNDFVSNLKQITDY